MPRKTFQICIKTETEDPLLEFKKVESDNKLQEHGETFKYLLERNRSEFFYERLECNDYSEYPLDKHFIQCSRGCGKGKKPHIRTRKDCLACAYENNKMVKAFIKSKEKWEQEISEREDKCSEVQRRLSEAQLKKEAQDADIVRKATALKKIDGLARMPAQIEQMKKEAETLKGQLTKEKETWRDLIQKNRYLEDYLKGISAEEQKTIKAPSPAIASNVGAHVEKTPQSVREAVEKFSEKKRPVPESHNEERSKPVQTVTQRVTEREKTEKEKIVEIVISDPFVNQEILCPNKGNYVSIVSECKKSCSDYVVCPYWEEINDGRIPQTARMRLREP